MAALVVRVGEEGRRSLAGDRPGVGRDRERRQLAELGVDDVEAVGGDVGPIRRGTLWESTAIPELRGQAERLATVVAAS